MELVFPYPAQALTCFGHSRSSGKRGRLVRLDSLPQQPLKSKRCARKPPSSPQSPSLSHSVHFHFTPMASKEDIENIHKSIEALSTMMQTLTTKVTTMEQNNATIVAVEKVKEKVSKNSEDLTYVEQPSTTLAVKDKLPE
ncbi:uncharacterized protein LOC110702826 [Chenopodium quinoa]|uniref:uncharacterized protein LOC110702826 n=1 Tax=Chenopodium quinoa TaxID=63459 RepID=UPI000B780D72|nr:uncharacterized protein LOC110702826 [Chenopodium quinoa]